MRELRNGYREAQAARVAIGNFDPYAIKPSTDSTSEGYTEFKKAADQMVYQEVDKSVGNPSQFIELVNRNPENIEFSGDRLLHAFNVTEDPQQLGQMKEDIDNIMSVPGGARALQAAFRDDFKNVVAVSALADVYTNGDVAKAKSILAESKGALVQGTLKPSLKERMYKNSTSLGTLGDEYIYSVNTLLNVNAGIVDKKMLDRLYDQFAEGYQERSGVAVKRI